MLDITSLERRWLKYKIKQFIPYITIVFIVVFLSLMTFIYLKTVNKPVIPQMKKENFTKKIQQSTPAEDAQMVLEPSMQFIQSLPPPVSNTDYIKSPMPIKTVPKVALSKKTAESLSLPAIQTKETIASPVMPLVKPVISTNKASTINRDTEVFDIHEIESRFKNNSNPHLGLYIARYHYDHGNYVEAYNYALKTNAINNSIEESWLIFAKSLVKLGKTDQAKKTLQMYISQSNSDNARNLLDSLGKGDTK